MHPFEKRQPVAVTLGTSYDQWCLSRIAETLGKKDEAAHYLQCSYNYRNIFNEATGFFHPKDKEGNWIEPFDYRYSGGIEPVNIMEKTTVGFIVGMYPITWLI